MNEEFTLLDAMEAVDEYITEKKNFNIKKGDYEKYKNYKDLNDDIRSYLKNGLAVDSEYFKKYATQGAVAGALTAAQLLTVKKLSKKYNELKNKEEKTDEDRKAMKKIKAKLAALGVGAGVTGYITGNSVGRGMYFGKEALSQKHRMDIYNAIDAKEKKKTESVDDLDILRLNVYESFEEGIISAEEKANMLELLNLDNYITEE